MIGRAHRRRTAAGLGLVALVAAVLPAISSSAQAASPHDDAGSAATKTKTITRIHLIDGKDQKVESDDFSLTVDQTSNLQNDQPVKVSWSGGHPSAGLAQDPNSAAGGGTEYPVVLLECRGVDSSSAPDSQQVSPETCWTNTSQERFFDEAGDRFPVWRLDRYAPPSERKAVVDAPTPFPSKCPAPDTSSDSTETQRWVPFVAADGTVYPFGQSGCAGQPPEAGDTASIEPSNETYAATATDGTGSSLFHVWNTEQNASLGCTTQVACTLVAVPILGISCDPSASSLPAEDQPAAGDEADSSAQACEANGALPPGGFAGGNVRANAAVTGRYWWSASNWRNRVSVPLSFGTSSSVCSLVGTSASTDFYGSELMSSAMSSWQPHFCTDSSLFRIKHVQTGEPQAVRLLDGGNVDAAFDADPPAAGFSTPTVNAPVGLTGFAITYQISGKDGKSVADIKLDPRLLAKLLSESYRGGYYLRGDYPYLADNPDNLSSDPEFQALNPGLPSDISYLASSSMLFASNDSDVMTALTAYIQADPEARAWLDGTPDPWGMTVNPSYKGIELPVSAWPLLDPTIPASLKNAQNNPCLYYSPVPYLPLIESPVLRWAYVTQHMAYAIPNDQTVCQVNQSNNAQSKFTASPRQTPSSQFLVGLTTLADAQRNRLPIAELETHSTASSTAKITGTDGRTFVGPTDAALQSAADQLAFDPTSRAWSLDYSGLRSQSSTSGAYPGAMLVYTSVPTTGLSASDAARYATFLRYAAGPGQVPGTAIGQLPVGYEPFTATPKLSAIGAYSLVAADAVADQKGAQPTPTKAASTPSSTPSASAASASGAKASPTPKASSGAKASALPTVAPSAAGASAGAPAVSGDTGTLPTPGTDGVSGSAPAVASSGTDTPTQVVSAGRTGPLDSGLGSGLLITLVVITLGAAGGSVALRSRFAL